MKEDNKEIPIGLGMSLAMNKKALENYGLLPYEEQKNISDFIQSSNTGYEAKNRIEKVVSNLENNVINYIIEE